MINFNRTLEVAGTSGFIQPIKLVQYDDTLPVGVFEFTENGQPFDIPSGAKAKVRMRKADGKGVYNDAVISGDTVQVVFTQQMTAAHGDGFLNIELIYDGGVKSSEPVQVTVMENAVQENTIESSDEFLTLEEILATCEKYGKLVEVNAGNIQTVVDNLTAIKNAPTEAAKAEAAADRAEAAAAESVGFRTFSQNIRPDENGDLDPTRPMLVGSGASVEMKSEGDRIQSVTVHGFTEQAGTGDASPANVREITVGGLQANLFPGFSKLGRYDISSGAFIQTSDGNVTSEKFSCKPNTDYFISIQRSVASSLRVLFWDSNDLFLSTVLITSGALNPKGTFKTPAKSAKLAVSAYSNGGNLSNYKNQLLVYGKTEAPYTTYTGEEYGTVVKTKGISELNKLIPLTVTLCEGDKVETCVKSGCDKKITLDGSILTVTDGGATYNATATDAVASGTVYANGLAGLTLDSGVVKIPKTSFPSDVTSASTANSWLKQNPQIIRYYSSEYTDKNDILVCLETHNKIKFTVDGSESVSQESSWWYKVKSPRFNIFGDFIAMDSVSGWKAKTVSSMFVPENPSNVSNKNVAAAGKQGAGYANELRIGFETSVNPGSAEAVKQFLQQKSDSGTPLEFVVPLALPAIYAHDPVYLESYPDGNGKFTVSCENVIDLYAKPFTNASTLNGKHADDFATADHVHNYAGSSSAGGAATTALACSGNATTATKLQTARTINGTSFDGSASITTANWGTSRNITIGNSTKSVNGSQNISYSLSDIGAMSIAGNEIVTVQATEFGGSVIPQYAKVEFKKFGRFVDVLVEVLIDNVNSNDTYEVCSLPSELSGLASGSYMGSCVSGDNATLYEHIARVSISSGKIWTRFAKGGLGGQYVKTHFMCFI